MRFIQDIPSENPGFQVAEYTEVLTDKILELDHLPAVIGIYGGWGTGKTTLMRSLERSLRSKDVKVLWLSAWKYNELEDVWSALIVELAAQIANESDGWDKASAVIRGVIVGGVKGVIKAAAKEIPFGEAALQLGGNVVSSIRSENTTSVSEAFNNRFESAFRGLVEEFIHYEDDKDAKLVVFLDDIDRCLPSKAINVLESVKLFLDYGPIVFIVGADRRIIESAIQGIYGANIEYHGRHYLEKIIQIQFPVPPYSRKGVVDLVFPRDSESDVLTEETRQLLAAWSQGNVRRVIQYNNAMASLEILLQFPENPLQRLTMDFITMLGLSHPEMMEDVLRLKDRALWADFIETFGSPEFDPSQWQVRIPRIAVLHERDPHLASTMRAAAAIFGRVLSNNQDKQTAVMRAFGSVTQKMTSV